MLTLVPEVYRVGRKVQGKYNGYPFYGTVVNVATNYRTKEAFLHIDVSGMSPPMHIMMVRKKIHLTVNLHTQTNEQRNHEITVR